MVTKLGAEGLEALGAGFESAACQILSLQVDMLALDGFDIGVGAGSILGGAASAEVACFGHKSILGVIKIKQVVSCSDRANLAHNY